MPLSLTDLPYTIFTTIITTHLTPSQTILCRRLSRAFLAALTRSDLCISLILAHFPRSLEGRRLRAYLKSNNIDALEGGDWAAVFARLARRYFHLGNALPWKIHKVKVLKDEEVLRGVAPWERHLSLNGKTAAFHFWDPVWTVAAGEGLLVYPAALLREEDYDASCVNDGGEGGGGGGARYRARDLQTGKEVDVPFDLRGKIVRRVRVSHGVLVFEWCEQELSRDEATTGRVRRHYATVYSVRRRGAWDGVIPQRGGGDGSSSEMMMAYTWEFELRCSDFAIHPVGLALDHQDRFFSTHNATHYAIYTWQPPNPASGSQENRGGGGPLESLTIWEFNPPTSDTTTTTTPEPPKSPRIIRAMSTRDLHHSAIRQGTAPALRAMALDDCTWDAPRSSACGHLFLTEEEHRWSAGPQSSSNPPRLHRVKTTGIPLVGEGPRWVDDCGGGGGVNLRFCWRGRWRRAMTEEAEDNDGVMLPHDEEDGSGEEEEEEDHASSPERAWSRSQTWPGRAPCWRHDDFPYVTLSEVFDAAAGVRVIARDCFMLETLSVHIRPRIRVQGVGPDGAKVVSRRASSGTATTMTLASTSTTTTNHESFSQQQTQIAAAGKNTAGGGGKTSTTTTEGPDGHEVQFADVMWSEMMGKGFICGDERWLVGEDTKGDVTVLVF